uniref:Uncharacterized protein n=1 Tax=Arundo donax TaxID=35708 RepID=A0A0A9FP94_ARUDO
MQLQKYQETTQTTMWRLIMEYSAGNRRQLLQL